MPKRSVFCIAASRGRADRIVHELKEADFSSTDISVIFLDRSPGSQSRTNNAAPASATAAATQSGGEIRGVLGWIAGIRSLVIPGIGPLIAAGPVAAILSSKTLGGIAGGLADFDVPQVEAVRYEGRIKDGSILIAVHSENPEKSDQARGIFAGNGAENVCTLIEVSTPKIHSRNADGSPRESIV
jgi:hypothetical protein